MGSERKKILILCTDDSGGAGIAMFRLLQGLKACGYTAKMLVKNKTVSDADVIQFNSPHQSITSKIVKSVKVRLTKPLKTNPAYSFFNPDERENYLAPKDILKHLDFTPEIILSTWISRFTNFSTIADLAILTKASVYVATVDMSPLTGGCHYAWDCKGYTTDCNNCPAILEPSKKDRAFKNLQLKQAAVKRGNIRALAGSAWTANQVKESALFRDQLVVPVFAGLIDEKIFNSKARGVVRRLFDIPEDAKVIFAGAINPKEKRKGFKEFSEALILLSNQMSEEQSGKVVVLVVGNNVLDDEAFPFKMKEVDYIKDERLLSYFYQAADVFVCPSLDESGPQMTLQAMACGTPVVCFQVGFGLDIVKNDYNGYSVPIGDTGLLACKMKNVIHADKEIHQYLSVNAQTTINNIASYHALDKAFEEL